MWSLFTLQRICLSASNSKSLIFQNIDYLIYIAECIEIFKVYDTKDIRCKDIRSRKLEHENSNHQFWNWVFTTKSNFLMLVSLQPDCINILYFKLKHFDLTEFIVWNIKGLQHRVAQISRFENQSLWQKLSSFETRSEKKAVHWNYGCSFTEFLNKTLQTGHKGRKGQIYVKITAMTFWSRSFSSYNFMHKYGRKMNPVTY